LESDHLRGLGVDPQAGCGGRAEGADRRAAGDLADDGGKAVASEAPPKYVRAAVPTSFTPFEARVRELLEDDAELPATVLAERVDWTGPITWFRENVKRLRPEHRRIDPADRRDIAA
jgi:hypothetical protein